MRARAHACMHAHRYLNCNTCTRTRAHSCAFLMSGTPAAPVLPLPGATGAAGRRVRPVLPGPRCGAPGAAVVLPACLVPGHVGRPPPRAPPRIRLVGTGGPYARVRRRFKARRAVSLRARLPGVDACPGPSSPYTWRGCVLAQLRTGCTPTEAESGAPARPWADPVTPLHASMPCDHGPHLMHTGAPSIQT